MQLELVNELYAGVFADTYGLNSVGLIYFNVFGKRQDPNGAYAAVIPKCILAMMQSKEVVINGDGESSRDFCYIDNVIQANLLAANLNATEEVPRVFNVAVGDKIVLNTLFQSLKEKISKVFPEVEHTTPSYQDFRSGDVRHSQADITKAKNFIGYKPQYNFNDGISIIFEWFLDNQEFFNKK